jgi:hypothetical protein
MRPDELERRLRARLNALGPAPRAELLHVLMLPDLERAVVTISEQAAKTSDLIDEAGLVCRPPGRSPGHDRGQDDAAGAPEDKGRARTGT